MIITRNFICNYEQILAGADELFDFRFYKTINLPFTMIFPRRFCNLNLFAKNFVYYAETLFVVFKQYFFWDTLGAGGHTFFLLSCLRAFRSFWNNTIFVQVKTLKYCGLTQQPPASVSQNNKISINDFSN